VRIASISSFAAISAIGSTSRPTLATVTTNSYAASSSLGFSSISATGRACRPSKTAYRAIYSSKCLAIQAIIALNSGLTI
jgi:hypothetical protein